MSDRTGIVVLHNIDCEVAELIAEKLNVDNMQALELFLNSETHDLVLQEELKLWHFSSLAIFDMWEKEQETGNPMDSLYIRGDEVE